MYVIAKECSKNYITDYCRKKGLYHLDIETLSHDSAIYCIEKYLKKESFKIEKISSYVYFGMIKNLFKDKEKDQLEVEYDNFFENHNFD
jgi:hypothetical protein